MVMLFLHKKANL